jgi:hypothetical protein
MLCEYEVCLMQALTKQCSCLAIQNHVGPNFLCQLAPNKEMIKSFSYLA